jgi:hypothetical protein
MFSRANPLRINGLARFAGFARCQPTSTVWTRHRTLCGTDPSPVQVANEVKPGVTFCSQPSLGTRHPFTMPAISRAQSARPRVSAFTTPFFMPSEIRALSATDFMATGTTVR